MEACMHTDRNTLKLRNIDIVNARLAQTIGLLQPLRMFLSEHPDDAAHVINGDALWAIEHLIQEAKAASKIAMT
jgi:hypothetical protein